MYLEKYNIYLCENSSVFFFLKKHKKNHNDLITYF